jgi:predicted DNA-binding transcriptional regulator AlpA
MTEITMTDTEITTASEVMTALEVAIFFLVSLSTLKRWIMLTRRGLLDFPMPLGAKGSQLKFRRSEILAWKSSVGNEPTQPVTIETIETPAERKKQNAKVARGLEKLGITPTRKERNP